jgi:hypothetical protein
MASRHGTVDTSNVCKHFTAVAGVGVVEGTYSAQPGNCPWCAIERLQAEMVGDARDAARYRFLRQPGNAIVYARNRNAWGQNASGHVRYDTAEQLDAAVDAAICVEPERPI